MLLGDHLIVIIVTYHRSVKGGCLNNPTQSFPRQPQNNPTQGSFYLDFREIYSITVKQQCTTSE